MKTAKMKKVLLAMGLGLGMSGFFAGSATAFDGTCEEYYDACYTYNLPGACRAYERSC